MNIKIEINLEITLNQSILFFLDYMRTWNAETAEGPTEKEVRKVLGEMTLTSFFTDVKDWVEELVILDGIDDYDGLRPTWEDCEGIVGFTLLYRNITELMYAHMAHERLLLNGWASN